eukprot:scaffold45516_cov28-Tisochrysis_lutea.AAC.1
MKKGQAGGADIHSEVEGCKEQLMSSARHSAKACMKDATKSTRLCAHTHMHTHARTSTHTHASTCIWTLRERHVHGHIQQQWQHMHTHSSTSGACTNKGTYTQ